MKTEVHSSYVLHSDFTTKEDDSLGQEHPGGQRDKEEGKPCECRSFIFFPKC